MTLSSVSDPKPSPTPEQLSQVGRWLEEYGEIATILPVLAGLLVTTQLRLRGGTALLVNLTIAAITRQTIIQLKKHGAPPSPPRLVEVAPAPAPPEEDYMIVHSVPGRIRLRIPRLQEDPPFAKRLEKLLQEQDIVLGVRVNRAARSIAIRYDEGHLSELELGMRLLDLLAQAEGAAAHG
ncbi:MAG: metal ABC transporter ATPase [Cyanobacteria bacterium]|nr:metal ABC transporter ATPase [Cyanobacteriota bacterium]